MKKITNNFSKKLTFTSKVLGLAMSILFFLLAGLQPTQAQTQAPSQEKIPAALVAKTQYTVNKALNPKISFDATTPNFTVLTIVDGNNMPVETVTATYVGQAVGNFTKKTFDFSGVTQGTYYAKGGDSKTTIYYKIDVK